MADYTGRDQRLSYLFQNGGGGGSACLYDAEKVNSIYSTTISTDGKVSSVVLAIAQANASLAEILAILEGGGGGGGSKWTDLIVTEKDYATSHWTEVE